MLDTLQDIAQHLLVKDNMRCAINVTSDARQVAVKHLDNFLTDVRGSSSKCQSVWTTDSEFQATTKQTHHVLPIPVNFTSKVVPGASYLSADFAPLRVLAGIMSAKFLHPEVREKGGAYGGGASASGAGLFSFYSYRDPKSLETIATFDRAVDWAMQANFSDDAIKEAKLKVFQRIDAPTSPSGKGMRLFLNHISDEQFAMHREQLIAVTKDDLVRVCKQYLKKPTAYGVTIIGPPNSALVRDSTWDVQFS